MPKLRAGAVCGRQPSSGLASAVSRRARQPSAVHLLELPLGGNSITAAVCRHPGSWHCSCCAADFSCCKGAPLPCRVICKQEACYTGRLRTPPQVVSPEPP